MDDIVALVFHLDCFGGLEDVFRHRLVPKLVDSNQEIFLLVDGGIAELLRPVEVVVHHLEHFGVIEQRDDAAPSHLSSGSRSLFLAFSSRKRAACTTWSG